jgi:8-amino-7-oxononanoate synthase
MNLLDRCAEFTEAKAAIRDGYYPYFIPLDENAGPDVVHRGRRLIMAGSNNYLGLTNDPRVQEAAIRAIRRYGTSCTGSRFLNGTLALHEELEGRLAAFLGKEAALCFSTGFQANLGVIASLVGRNDRIILDKEDHASLYDGARLSSAKLHRFSHNHPAELENMLAAAAHQGGTLVAVDGVFSMEGDLAPLPELARLCRRHRAQLLVDDAHGIGVMGDGHGTEAHFGMADGVDLTVGTLSKSFASLGGFVAGRGDVIHYLKHHARSLIFSAAMPPACAAAALAALDIIGTEPGRIATLHRNADRMRQELTAMGFDTGNSATPIVPVVVGDRRKTVAAARAMLDEGVFVYPIIAPAVPATRSLLRTSYMATHTSDHLDRILAAFAKVGRKFGLANRDGRF